MVPRTSVRFYKVVRGATPPMAADKSALGTMPMGPYQYCEAMRAASSFGWYLFPLEDTIVRWDGHDIYTWQDEEWQDLSSVGLAEEDLEVWRQNAPPDLEPPPVLTGLFVPGILQLWTGLLVATGPDWSVHVRPLANLTRSRAYLPYEGIIETDEFRPCPLFINVRLIEVDRDIHFAKEKPLFQVQPLPRVAYTSARNAEIIDLEAMEPAEWEGIRKTTRAPGERAPGAYAAEVRKRAKRDARG